MTPPQPDTTATPATGVPAAPATGVPAAPAIVVHGDATPEEVAALVAVLSAVSGGEDPASDGATSTWTARSAVMRRPVGHGPGAWRTALRP